ncbi:MAG TPA: hypothetical protein VKT81_17695 [Bryobacteraceae bacterium]|nr:hypothetical protein [Bryobacteraceae bacterium]
MVLTTMRRAATLLLIFAIGMPAASPNPVRFLRSTDVPSLALIFAGSSEKPPDLSEPSDWDTWIRERDAVIRGRIDHGIEDSLSELILFGTSFPAPPKLAAASDAVNAAGDLTASARARRDAFVKALDDIDSERFRMVIEFLRRQKVSEGELPGFLTGILRRFALEETGLKKQQARADAGVSPETSLLINYAIDDTLRTLKTNHTLPARVQRIAVIGPGLDLAGDPDVNDFCPPQSLQPFAILDTVLRMGVATATDVQMSVVDFNPLIVSHLRSALAKPGAVPHYVLQLPRPQSAGWNAGALSYWQHFGEAIGTPATAAAAPQGMEMRAVAIKPAIATRIFVDDLNIVTQTLDTVPGQGFDLVIATNLFAYYTRVEQELALTSVARMLASGGILIANGLLPGVKLAEFEELGAHHVAYSDSGSGDDLLVYKRR